MLTEFMKMEKITEPIPYRLQFIEDKRLMACLLTSLVNSLAKENHWTKCKYGYHNKKYETCGMKYKDCQCCIEYTNVKDGLIEHKCFCCNKNT